MRHPLFGIGVTVATLLLSSCSSNNGNFSLANNTHEPIARATVAICGQAIELKDIQPNNSAIGSYKVRSDSHYVIQIEFQSGKKLQKQTGYVTNGMDFDHKIVVSESDIAIVDSKAH
jgi:hypothetical protein